MLLNLFLERYLFGFINDKYIEIFNDVCIKGVFACEILFVKWEIFFLMSLNIRKLRNMALIFFCK